MLDHYFRRPRVRARIRANILGGWIELYVSYLHQRGHPPGSSQLYVQAVEHFGVWLASEHGNVESVTRATIDSFLYDHLPDCRCPTPSPTYLYQVRVALAHLPHVPGIHLSPAQPASPGNPVDVTLEHYGRYLRDTCGLAEPTCLYRVRYAREFLQANFADGPVRWETIRPEDVMAFTAGYAARCRPQSAQVAASSLRSLLRFLQLRGECESVLVAAVPDIPSWRLDHLPRTMTDEQLRLFLARFDRSTPTGRRDYALALCQVDLGLRVSEVSALRLEDVDILNPPQATRL
jgi:site-specific recombinase XerD